MNRCPRCNKAMKDNAGKEIYHNGSEYTLEGDHEKDFVQFVVGNDCADRFIIELNQTGE